MYFNLCSTIHLTELTKACQLKYLQDYLIANDDVCLVMFDGLISENPCFRVDRKGRTIKTNITTTRETTIFSYKYRKTCYKYTVKIRSTYVTQRGGRKISVSWLHLRFSSFWSATWQARFSDFCLPEPATDGSATTNTHQVTSTLTGNVIIIRSAWQPRWHNNNKVYMSCT